MMRVLYHSWLEAGSLLTRIVLAEKKLETHLRLEKPWERRPEFLRLNPAGTVPVLVEDKTVFCDAMAICEYLDESNPSPPLIGEDPKARAEVRRLTSWFMGKYQTEVTTHLITEKLMKRFLRMGEPDSGAIRSAHHNLKIHMDYLDFLTERRNYLAGPQFSLADAACAAQISIADYFSDVPWDRHQNAREWYMRVKSRRSVRLLLKDRIPGLIPPKHYERPDF
ncbi:glutathione S-transferase [Iodidimonas gelatinilytica]|uniref:Glutathione S-transferase n=1 Tax=Iodidimonas gelatinilytica TaxID=1236966 RepID=A0A5A7MNH7_9PROT|nr:glutathione S-transferase family protein [Iodidimonas gelatinilytica]GEQ97406.1 glutathione S-transferase [Iodidimonas gelatinilytica]GER02153.1 glutathione S-transferase [Iodidimonas gelatinilytica]